MFQILNKDLFEDLGEKDLVVHGCNNIGAFGAGIAGIIRSKYPDVHEQYVNYPHMMLGNVQFVPRESKIPTDPRENFRQFTIANAITQKGVGIIKIRDYRLACASPAHIYEALLRCIVYAEDNELTRIVSPWIGCGLGGLKTSDVYPHFAAAAGGADKKGIEFEVRYL